MSIDTNMLEIPGKLFDPEKIYFKTFTQNANQNSGTSL